MEVESVLLRHESAFTFFFSFINIVQIGRERYNEYKEMIQEEWVHFEQLPMVLCVLDS